jgi:hypothetical protein
MASRVVDRGNAGQYSAARLRAGAAADVLVLLVAAAFYVAIGADNVASWPDNRVLISEAGTGLLFLLIWLLCVPCSLASSVMLYGWPGMRSRPAEARRAIFLRAPQRPARAKRPPAMRRPPIWMWLLLTILAAGCVAVVAGSAAAGTDKGQLRTLPNHRFEVSAISLHDSAWTVVSARDAQAYRAKFMRTSSVAMFVALLLIGNSGYALFIRGQLLAHRRR